MSPHDENPPTVSYASPDTTHPINPRAIAAIIFALLPFALVIALFNSDPHWEGLSELLIILIMVSLPTAIVLGAPAYRQAPTPTHPDRRLAIIAIVIASIQLAIILANVVFLSSSNASRMRALRAKCTSNLRQVGLALVRYANDQNGVFPPTLDLLVAHANARPEIFVCPSGNDEVATGPTTQAVLTEFAKPGHCSYVYLGAGQTRSSLSADYIVAYEPLRNHDGEGIHVLHNDGYVQWLFRDLAQHYISELAAGHNPPRGPATLPSVGR